MNIEGLYTNNGSQPGHNRFIEYGRFAITQKKLTRQIPNSNVDASTSDAEPKAERAAPSLGTSKSKVSGQLLSCAKEFTSSYSFLVDMFTGC